MKILRHMSSNGQGNHLGVVLSEPDAIDQAAGLMHAVMFLRYRSVRKRGCAECETYGEKKGGGGWGRGWG